MEPCLLSEENPGDVTAKSELQSVVLNILLQQMIMCWDLMSTGTCVMSSEMDDISGVNEKSALVPKNNFVLACLGCALYLLF